MNGWVRDRYRSWSNCPLRWRRRKCCWMLCPMLMFHAVSSWSTQLMTFCSFGSPVYWTHCMANSILGAHSKRSSSWMWRNSFSSRIFSLSPQSRMLLAICLSFDNLPVEANVFFAQKSSSSLTENSRWKTWVWRSVKATFPSNPIWRSRTDMFSAREKSSISHTAPPIACTPLAFAARMTRACNCVMASFFGVERPPDVATKSSTPLIIATTRGLAEAMSNVWKNPTGHSMIGMKEKYPRGRPRWASRFETSSSMMRTHPALSAFGIMMVLSFGKTTSSKSAKSSSINLRPLTRRQSVCPLCTSSRSLPSNASRKSRLAAFLALGATESSMSMTTQSLRVKCALRSTFSSLFKKRTVRRHGGERL